MRWYPKSPRGFLVARPLRITFEATLYYVTSRGKEARKIFLFHEDSKKLLSYLTDLTVSIQKQGVILQGSVLMPNAYHPLIETHNGNLSSFIHGFNSAYTPYSNTRR